MDGNTPDASNPQSGNQNRNRMVLLLVAGIPVTIILAATWLWFFVAHGDLDLVSMVGTANRGDLVQPPREMDATALQEQGGAAFLYSDLAPKWTMLVPVPAAGCDADCEHSLYVTRQIHIALGKGFNRVQRMAVGAAPVKELEMAVAKLSDGRPTPLDFASYLDQEHGDLTTLLIPTDAYQAVFPEYMSDHSTWYLVDPAGWIMMSYHAGIPYKDVLSDLKFLLKNSSE